MSRLKIYDPSGPQENITRERSLAYLQLTPKEKIERLFTLIKLSIALNGGKPIKYPLKKGIVISRNR